jgi:4'-phosphopantetheinyl transferase
MKNMQISKVLISVSNVKGVQLIANHSLNTDEVIIYTIYFPNFINLKYDLAKFLNSAELNRADRFHKELDKNRFIICRSILKIVLAAYTKLDAKNINLDYHYNKKPYLASYPSLHFNVSHSEDFAVIAISHHKVGIDIEYIAKYFDFNTILFDVFSAQEILAIQNATDKKHAFYTSWTRKEAFVKALGRGIDDDFKNIPCLDGAHSLDSNQLNTNENWQIYSFDLADQYLAAVAVESLPTITPKLVIYTIPNTMKALIEEMAQPQ